MSLRDADSLHLESAKVPELRRRGRVEPMALPELEHALLEDFVQQVTSETDRDMLGAGSVAVTFTDPDGGAYTVSIHRVERGYQLVARRASPSRSVVGKSAASAVEVSTPVARVGGQARSGAALGGGAAAGGAAEVGDGPVGSGPPGLVATTLHEPASDEASWLGAAGGPLPLGPAVGLPVGLPVGPALRTLLLEAAARGASDLLVSSGRAPWVKVAGTLSELTAAPLADEDLRVLAHACGRLPAARGQGAGSADFALEVHGVRARGNVFSHQDGVALALRLLAETVPGLADLGLPPGVGDAVSFREGLVLVCGSTGSGKSTTLAALVHRLDAQRAAHVITLEDPVEYRLRGQRGLIHQRELGTDFVSFAAGLRAALRESPDVIVLGELRDAESATAALGAAETGHLVLATMHAPGATGAIDRILDLFDERRQRQARTQLASALRMVVTQTLLARLGGGRVAAAEVVPVTAAVANIIRKGELQTLSTAIQSGRDVGMVPLERSLAQLVQRGLVGEAEAQRAATDSALLRAQLG